MQFQVKFLRRAGVHLSHADVEALPWVVAQVVTSKTGAKRLCLHPLSVNLVLNPQPKRELFKYSLHELSDRTQTYFGVEHLLHPDGTVAAVGQEWMLTGVSIGSGGWPAARERGITDDLDQLYC
jgi:hypothetical protein